MPTHRRKAAWFGTSRFRWITKKSCECIVPLITAAMLIVTCEGQTERIPANLHSLEDAVISGHISPRTRTLPDRGVVTDNLSIRHVRLVLKRSDAQQRDLDRLLDQQRDPASPSFHHWLTPEEFAERFGFSEKDIGKLAGWLSSEGFSVEQIARSRNWIAFTGTAGQFTKTFGLQFHSFDLDGRTYFANVNEPLLPGALRPAIIGFSGLNSFHPKTVTRFNRGQFRSCLPAARVH